MFYLTFLFSMTGILLSIAFFTLMERKIMGISHYRKGPNKVMIWGISQPLSDAMKLLKKEKLKMKLMKIYMFLLGPSLTLILMTTCWLFYESFFMTLSVKMKIFTIMATMSMSPFLFLLSSWGSNSKYAILGGYRAISQVISYEICFMIFLLILFYLTKSYSMKAIMMIQEYWWLMLLSPPLFMCWMLLCLAESNRPPFDLAEGESEIVSGFNIEFGGTLFAMIFIAEYGMIMFLCFLSSILFMGGNMIMIKTMTLCFLFIWIRCSFPRMRYDKLMNLCWKILLPYSLSLTMVSLSIFF